MDTLPPLSDRPAGKAWERIGIKSHHGINVPLFSLRSRHSMGVGDFNDLKTLIDWVSDVGFDVIQLLPLYDSGDDPSPYNLLSANALHPLYIHVEPDGSEESQKLQGLNREKRLDYHEVLRLKMILLKRAFDRSSKEVSIHFSWLDIYGSYKASRDPENALFYKWVQNKAFNQLSAVKRYAESKGVFLKGDLPILVSPDSIDVKTHPELFDLSVAAGAPPDQYNREGQRWGFPIYRYDALVKEHFSFWKERLKSAAPLYHLYRLDHIVGLFRLWAVPEGKLPKEGHYVPEDRNVWQERGHHYLQEFLNDCSLLPVGEDLGIIPHEARETMDYLGIPGTKVIRWERRWKGDHTYIPYAEYPVNSMTTVSTHDAPSLRLWWETHPEEAQDFALFKGWEYEPVLHFKRHQEILHDSHHTPSLLHINLLQEYTSLFPELTYPDLNDERINHPGTISPLNWSYRTRPFLEEIVVHQGLKQVMQELIR